MNVLNAKVTAKDPSTWMSADELGKREAVIGRGKKTFVEVGNALAAIRDGLGYRRLGFPSFDSYCRARWGWSRQHGYRLLQAAKLVESLPVESPPDGPNLSPMGDTAPPRTERAARRLAQQRAVTTLASEPAHTAAATVPPPVLRHEITPSDEVSVLLWNITRDLGICLRKLPGDSDLRVILDLVKARQERIGVERRERIGVQEKS